MPRERKTEFQNYSERLIPTRVTITRQRGNFKYSFEIDGFKGERTGQIYYKGSEVSKIEHSLQAKDAISSYRSNNFGLVIQFQTPQAFLYPEVDSSVTISEVPQDFGTQNRPNTWRAQPSAYMGNTQPTRMVNSIIPPSGIETDVLDIFRLQPKPDTSLLFQARTAATFVEKRR